MPRGLFFTLLITFGLGTASMAGAAGESERVLDAWNQGRRLLDEGRIEAATRHFQLQIQLDPGNLVYWESLSRAEHCRSHADTIISEIRAQLPDSTNSRSLNRRFIAALQLRNEVQYLAAADSFLAVARACSLRGDHLSALVVSQTAASCLVSHQDPKLGPSIISILENAGAVDAPHLRLENESRVIIAHTYFLQDELDQAEDLYHLALVVARENEYRVTEGEILNALGGIKSKRRLLNESKVLYLQAVQNSRETRDSRRLLLILSNLGYLETHLRQLDEARQHLMEANDLAHKWGYSLSLGLIHSGLGAVAEMSGDRVEAVAQFEKAIELGKDSGNIFIELGSRQRMAYNQAMMGSYTEAQNNYETCLKTLQERDAKFILNWVYGGLAVTNHKLGYLDRAAEYYRLAQTINLEMGDQMSATWCLNSLGVIQAVRGDYQQALVTHFQVLDEYKAMGDLEGVGEAQASIAEVYYQLGNYHQALHYSDQAIDSAEKNNAEELLRRASQTIATVYAATAQPELAVETYQKVIEITRRWNEPVVEIWALNGLAEQYLTLGQNDKAHEMLMRALEMMEDQEYYHVRSESCRLLGRAADSRAEAIEWATQAVELAVAGGLAELEWKSLSDLGYYHFQNGDQKQAVEILGQAVDLVESLRQQVGSDELRRHMLRPALQPYERLIQVHLAEPGNPAAAFLTSERSRARTLAGRLNAALAHNSQRPARTTDPKERDLAATITFFQSQLQDGGLNKSVRDSLRHRITHLEEEFALLKLRWSVEEESSAGLLFPAEPVIEELLKTLEPDEHLLSYFLGSEESYLFSVNHTGVKAYTLPNRQILEDKIRLFIGLQKASSESDLPQHIINTARQELNHLLIEPARQDILPTATLILVPDGLLHRLPFAYLNDGQTYLFENHETFTAPSLQTLSYLRHDTRRPGKAAGQNGSRILAISCQGLADDSEAATTRLHPFTDAAIPRLSHADEEAWKLASLFDNAVILTGNGANEDRVRSGIMADADIIHLAAHSYADEVDPRRSYILLNRGSDEPEHPDQEAYDGLLLWHEILALDLNASLVTLASCRSAGGMLTLGEGITGLTQAFLHAGSRCVLASQIEAPDGETRWFMDHFYEELAQGAPATTALRKARMAALEYNSDGFGSLAGMGFVLTGDGTVTYGQATSHVGRNRVLAGCLLLLVVGMVVFRRK